MKKKNRKKNLKVLNLERSVKYGYNILLQKIKIKSL